MNELEKNIFALMQKGLSLNSIQEVLQLSSSELSSALKTIRTECQNFQRSFHSNGTYFLIPSDNPLPLSSVRINTSNDSLRALFISDLHVGNSKDRIELLDVVYNHAIKEGIHTIFNTGDLIENIYYLPTRKLKLVTLEGQIKRTIKYYPYDPHITNFILYGNHDYKALTEYDTDIASYIESERYDLVSLGYGESSINIAADKFTLQHNITNKPHMSVPEDTSIVFRGHSHKMKYNMKKDIPIILVPSLSDATPESYTDPPQKGFIDCEFHINDEGLISRVYMKHYAVETKKNLSSEFVLSLRRGYHD